MKLLNVKPSSPFGIVIPRSSRASLRASQASSSVISLAVVPVIGTVTSRTLSSVALGTLTTMLYEVSVLGVQIAVASRFFATLYSKLSPSL